MNGAVNATFTCRGQTFKYNMSQPADSVNNRAVTTLALWLRLMEDGLTTARAGEALTMAKTIMGIKYDAPESDNIECGAIEWLAENMETK
jgi:hypothetical protein